MGKHLTWMLAVATATVGVASVASAGVAPTVVRVGNMVVKIEGGLTPTALPKSKLAPVTLHVNGELGTADGSQPPALKEVIFDSDKNAIINAKGLPACRARQLIAQDSAHAEKACPEAIVGRGSGTVRVAFPEQAPFKAVGPLLIFNGGVSGGVTTVLIHVYVNVPAPTAVVTTLKITKEHKGRFGLHTVASIPLIAGGSGSITNFAFTLHRDFTYKGKQQSFLEARCSGGHFAALATFDFRDGSSLTGEFIRPCKARG